MTVNQALRQAEDTLRQAGVGSPGTDACVLMAHVLGETLSHLPTRFRSELGSAEQERFDALVSRRALREPLAYITGDTWFMGLQFHCDPRAFVPRPDTEILVETVLKQIGEMGAATADEPVLIAEIGTGTGCIAISLAHHLAAARLFASDVSAEAVELARENARLNGVEARVQFACGPDLEPLKAAGLLDRIAVLVSNPPYIPVGEVPTLEPEVSQAEPRVALEGGHDGLEFYRRILPQVASLPSLRLVAFEFGVEEDEPLGRLFEELLPGWSWHVEMDLAGLPRVIWAARKA